MPAKIDDFRIDNRKRLFKMQNTPTHTKKKGTGGQMQVLLQDYKIKRQR